MVKIVFNVGILLQERQEVLLRQEVLSRTKSDRSFGVS